VFNKLYLHHYNSFNKPELRTDIFSQITLNIFGNFVY